jgi:hypothetical protein
MSFKPMFEVQGQWCGNAQAFATREEAEASAKARFNVWTVPSGYRADESDEPVSYRWDFATGTDVPLNRYE